MDLVSRIEISKSCWCIVALLVLNGLAFYKPWCMKMAQVLPSKWASTCAQSWDLSNYTRIKMVYNKILASTIRAAKIASPVMNAGVSVMDNQRRDIEMSK